MLMYCSGLFVVFQEIILLNMPMFVGSQSLISLMFVSAAVSEIHELNQNKKEEEERILKLAISNLSPFQGIQFAHFLTRGTF